MSKFTETVSDPGLPKCLDVTALLSEFSGYSTPSGKFTFADLWKEAKQGVVLGLTERQRARIAACQAMLTAELTNAKIYKSCSGYTPTTIVKALDALSFILSTDFDQKQRVPLRKILPKDGRQQQLNIPLTD